MEDLVLRYVVQFATVTAACMVLAEWGTPKALIRLPKPKRVMALAYALILNALAWKAGLLLLPEVATGTLAQFAGVVVLSVVSTATAGLVADKVNRGS